LKLIKKVVNPNHPDGIQTTLFFDKGRKSVHLRNPTQRYIENEIEPARPYLEEFHRILKEGEEQGLKLNQLARARTTDPTRIATEDAIFKDTTDAMTTDELNQVVSKLEWLGGKTFQQVDTYIDNNVIDLQSARAFLKILAKVVLAILKLVLILARRELPP